MLQSQFWRFLHFFRQKIGDFVKNQCFNLNFLAILPIFGIKLRFSKKTMLSSKFLQNLAVHFIQKNLFFGENIFEIITPAPNKRNSKLCQISNTVQCEAKDS
jgi:hypothetical protein